MFEDEDDQSNRNAPEWAIPGVTASGNSSRATGSESISPRPLQPGTAEAESTSLVAVAQAIGELLDSLPLDVAAVAPDALAALRQLMPRVGQLHTVVAQLAVLADADGLHALDGSKSILAHMARKLPISFSQAKTHLVVGRSLRDHLPSTLVAMRSGSLAWDAGHVMASLATSTQATLQALDVPVPADAYEHQVIKILRQHAEAGNHDHDTGPVAGNAPSTTSQQAVSAANSGEPPTSSLNEAAAGGSCALADGWVRCEDWLVAQGVKLTVARFRRLLKYWVAMVDPEASERSYKEREADAYVAAGQTLDCCHIQGKLAPEGGKVLLAALDAFRPTYDADHPTRIAERNACALETIARIALETNLAGDSASARPHIGLTISWETFCAMAAHAGTPAAQLAAMADLPPAEWADGTGPIPASVTASIACDSDITRIVFGPRGQLINLGRTNRVITPGLRQAVVARDKHCVVTGCDAPPVLCQAHHLHRWSHGGKTDADNLALLCGHHHRWIHANNITIRPRGPAPGKQVRPGNSPGTTSTGHPPSAGDPPGQGDPANTQPTYDFIDRHGQPINV